MPANDFLTPGTSTTLTLVYDRPKEGETRFGAYRAYRVLTPDGSEHTFFPPRSLYPELDRLNLGRGSRLTVHTSQRVSEDGRAFPRYDVTPVDGPAQPTPAATHERPSNGNSILASVALKAAVSSGSTFSEPDAILAIADRYLAWLVARAGA